MLLALEMKERPQIKDHKRSPLEVCRVVNEEFPVLRACLPSDTSVWPGETHFFFFLNFNPQSWKRMYRCLSANKHTVVISCSWISGAEAVQGLSFAALWAFWLLMLPPS